MTNWYSSTSVPAHSPKDCIDLVELMLLRKLEVKAIANDEDEVNEIHIALKQVRTLP